MRGWALSTLLLVALGCGSSHEADLDAGDDGVDAGCDTGGLVCRSVAGRVAPDCCHDNEVVPECLPDGTARCPSGTLEDSACRGIVERGECEGPPPDSGPPPTDWRSCSVPSDCTLMANGCCAACGRPELMDVVAANAERTDEAYLALCPESADGAVDCPACATMPNPDLVATCASERCEAFDVSMDELSSCADGTECVVRVRDCCPCGADTSLGNLIAIAADHVGDYADRVCDPMMACPECEPAYPDDVSATCGPDGHCDLVTTGTGTRR